MLRNTNVQERKLPELKHGTSAGYRGHKRRGETPCARCKASWAAYISAYRARHGR